MIKMLFKCFECSSDCFSFQCHMWMQCATVDDRMKLKKEHTQSQRLSFVNISRLHAKQLQMMTVEIEWKRMWFTILCQKHPPHVPFRIIPKQLFAEGSRLLLPHPLLLRRSRSDTTRLSQCTHSICCIIVLVHTYNGQDGIAPTRYKLVKL